MQLSCNASNTVDYIFYNGKIFTAAGENEFVTAIAIKNGIISGSGTDKNILKQFSAARNRKINLQKQLVLPGFHDAHLHLRNGARLLQQLDLRNIKSRDKVIQKITDAVSRAEKGTWILGRGWDHELWLDKKLPDKKLLDKITTEHFIYLRRVDGHAGWVNSAVLNLLDISAKSTDPYGGKIIRYDNSREPTRILIDAAEQVVTNAIPEATFYEKYSWVKNVIPFANELGITSVTDNSPGVFYKVYSELHKQGLLSLRINFWVNYMDNLDSLKSYLNSFPEIPGFLKADLIKLYADGSLGSRSAYLKSDYLDSPGNKGLPQYPLEKLLQISQNTVNKNFYLGIHAIGDAGIHQVLEVYENIKKEFPNQDHRFRMEHAQMIDPADFKKFKELKVIASMQPSHCITDLHWAENRIGDRARYSYSWNSFLKNGIRLAFGTDWPVEPLNPMVGLYAAVTRQDTLGFPEGGWYPEERITLGQAIIAYTAGSAYAARNENWCGTLESGKVADFIILDRDLFKISPNEILKTKILSTYIAGEKVYSRK